MIWFILKVNLICYDIIEYAKNMLDIELNDYIYVTLTDEQDIPDAIGRLRILYPNIMKLDYDNTRTRKYNDSFDADIEQRQEKQPIELFEELYELQNNQQMDNEQREYINHIIEEIWV